MVTYVHELTTATIFGYFDATLKECIENILKSMWDAGRIFFFRYVTGKYRLPSPIIFLTICHGSRDTYCYSLIVPLSTQP